MNFPKHNFSQLTYVCTRCFRTEQELAESFVPISCMTDNEISQTELDGARFLARLRTNPT